MALLAHATDHSLYQRFLSASPAAAREYLDALEDPARTLDAAVVLVRGHIVAVGSTHPTRLPTVAEVALLVDDQHQELGLGTLLLEELVTRAHHRGLRSLTALALTSNAQIMRVLRDLGRDVTYDVDGETVTASIDVSERGQPPATRQRHRESAAHSLEPFLRPRSIVVVGSAPRPPRAYREIVAKLRQSDHRLRISTSRLHHSARRPPWLSPQHAVESGADLAVLVVRPDELRDAVQACLRSGIRAVASLGPSLATRPEPQADELAAACAEAGVRLLGPDSCGLLNTDPAQAFDATTMPFAVRAGEVCLVGTTRREVTAVTALLDVMGVGLSLLVSLGEGADITAADVLAFAAEDRRSRVTVVCLDGPASEDLSLVDVDGGTTVVLYHPPGAAPRPELVPPAGAIVTRSWMELADTVVVLLCQPRPSGRRVAVVTTSPTTLAAADEMVESVGLLVADVTQHTEMRTRLVVPMATHTGGLVLLPAGTEPGDVGLVLRTLADDPGVDVVVLATGSGPWRPADLSAFLDDVSRDYPHVTFVSAGPAAGAPAARRPGTVPTLPDFRRAAVALANARRD